MNNLFTMQIKRGATMQNEPNEQTHNCDLCGRKLGAKYYEVEIDIDGFEFYRGNHNDSQGYFWLDSECAKKFSTAKAVTR